MATVVDICNLALSHLGDLATVASIDPPEGSAQASHCARFYPIARDFLLEYHDWGFNTKRAALADATATAAPPPWFAFSYAVPSDCVRILNVSSPDDQSDDVKHEYKRETVDGADIIYTNVETAVLRYTWRVTDPTKYSGMFVDALGRLLASYLAGPLIKGDEGAKMADAQYRAALAVAGLARTSDAQQTNSDAYRDPARAQPPWIAGRFPAGNSRG